jgi:hypothetical protein
VAENYIAYWKAVSVYTDAEAARQPLSTSSRRTLPPMS